MRWVRVLRLRREAASVAVLAAARRARVAWITGHIDLGAVMTASSPLTAHRS